VNLEVHDAAQCFSSLHALDMSKVSQAALCLAFPRPADNNQAEQDEGSDAHANYSSTMPLVRPEQPSAGEFIKC